MRVYVRRFSERFSGLNPERVGDSVGSLFASRRADGREKKTASAVALSGARGCPKSKNCVLTFKTLYF